MMAKKKKCTPSTDIEIVIASLQKEFGNEAIYQLGGSPMPEIKRISSGSLSLDRALGGGYPEGRIIEIYGPESSGKSTLMLHLIAEAQKAGGLCAFVDAEHALDIVYANALGVDTDELIISQPGCGEEALRITEQLTRSEKVSVIIIDSVASLVPKAELEGEIGDNHVGRQSRLMSQALRTLASLANKTNTLIAFTNQIRMKIGVMFGNPETTSGGNALKFYASQRLDIRRIALNKDPKTGETFSIRSRVRVIKNKVAPPFREAQFNINFGTGIDRLDEMIDLGVEYELIEKSGAWYIVNNQKIQGTRNLVSYLQDHPEFALELNNNIIEVLKTGDICH